MLTIYGRRNALNVQKVMWFVAELGLPYRHVLRTRAAYRRRVMIRLANCSDGCHTDGQNLH